MYQNLACSVLALLVTGQLAVAQNLEVVSYNVESGGADPNVVAERLGNHNGADIWGLSEVRNQSWANIFEHAAEDGENADFAQILGTTGGADRLLILYDSDRLELVDSEELHNINPGGRVRAPLVAHFRLKSDGAEFYFMVNHLYRSRSVQRHAQAQLLNEWTSDRAIPVIAVGDYNFDWSVQNGDTDHDEGYDHLTANNVFDWIRPATLVRTQDSNFNSVLDFVFASSAAKTWGVSSTILVEDGDFPDSNSTSDHRPLRARFDLSRTAGVSKAELIQRIEALKTQIEELEQLIRRLP